MNWSNINDKIFEKIACAYANDIYKEYKWIATGSSWDGNKDAFFREKIEPLKRYYEGWCEAKYTTNLGTSIPKSHMDSTLVSGILDGKVIFILFVTNGKITPGFMQRAKAILEPHNISIRFVEGNILTDWIRTKPDLISKYFYGLETDLSSADLQLEIVDSCFLNAIMSAPSLISPVLKLKINSEYFLYLNIYSNQEVAVSIELNTNAIKRIPQEDNINEISPGYNSFLIRYIAKYPYEDELNLSLYVEDELKLSSKILDLFVEENDSPLIVYSEQQNILQKLYSCTKVKISKNMILQVSGKEGSGKTYLLKELIVSIADKYNEVLCINFSEKEAENASLLCKMILFINFGFLYDLSEVAFTKLIKEYTNFPFEIYLELREGTTNQITALNAIKKINNLMETNSCALFPNINMVIHRNTTYILMDDFHKLSGTNAVVSSYILEEFILRDYSQILIIGNRPGEFHDLNLERILEKLHVGNWSLSGISVTDVSSSIQTNFNNEIVNMVELFPVPVSVLHLELLLKKLKEKNILNYAKEKRGVLFAEAYKETNINNNQFAVSKIQSCKYLDLIYIVYKIESGVPINLLKKFYGNKYFISSKHFMRDTLIKEENEILKPYHDIYVYAFAQIFFPDTYMDELNKFLQFCISEEIDNSILFSNILSILIAKDNRLRNNYLDLAREICANYYAKSQYIAAQNLALELLPNLDVTSYNQYKYEDLELLYIFAQAEKYSKTHVGSSKYLKLIADIGDVLSLNSKEKGIVQESHSELITNYLYSLQFDDVENELKYFEKNLKNKTDTNSSQHKINAYLNFMNRTILYTFFKGTKNLQEAYYEAYNESKRLGRIDYQGYADMDYGKILIYDDKEKALTLFEKALPIFVENSQCAKRRVDCMAGIIFLKHILKGKSYDDLYNLQKEAFENKYIHVYARITLVLLTLELMDGEKPDTIEKKLTKLLIDYPDLRGYNRLALFANQLFTIIYFKAENYHKQSRFAEKHLQLANKLSRHYVIIPEHNRNRINSNTVVWYFSNKDIDKNSLWVDPKIW